MTKRELSTETMEELPVEVATKTVRNRSRGKIELYVNGEVVVILPGESVRVPLELDIPSGIGLQVK